MGDGPLAKLRPRFTLRTLLVLVTLAAALFGNESYISWKEQQAARAIEKLYGSVTYGHSGPEWLRRIAGEDYLRRVKGVRIHVATVSDAIPHLQRMRRLEHVQIILDTPVRYRFDRPAFDAALPNVRYYLSLANWWINDEWTNSQLAPVMDNLAAERFALLKERCGIVLKTGKGRYRTLLLGGGGPPAPASLAAMVRPIGGGQGPAPMLLLIEGDQLIDSWQVVGDFKAGLRAGVGDLDNDGLMEAGFCYPPGTAPHGAKLLMHDPRSWHAAFEITPTGFEPLFEESSGQDKSLADGQ